MQSRKWQIDTIHNVISPVQVLYGLANCHLKYLEHIFGTLNSLTDAKSIAALHGKQHIMYLTQPYD